jgi:uncharacterized membrane protein
MKRILSIDITRGIVMVIMALDHVRDLMHIHSIDGSPSNLSTTTPLLFFTRWITYLCAPIFVFLSGTSAFLSLHHKKDVTKARSFLLKRGLWMLVLEFTIVNFGMFFDLGFHLMMFEVIATFGFGFIILSLLLKCSTRTILIIGLLIIFCHDLFSFLKLSPGPVTQVITSLFTLNAIPLSQSRVFFIAYPPIPWLGIMLVGFATGKLFLMDAVQRGKILLLVGTGALLLFITLRFTNYYGDPAKWTTQKSGVYTFLSFMNVSKYPPSLLFCLVTLGIMFLILFLAERTRNWLSEFAIVYGRVPLFYFIVHFYFIHLLLLVILSAQGFHWNQFDFASGTFGRPKGVTSGIPLWAVYLVWAGVVLILYKPCTWYWKYKATHNFWWLRYI